MEKKKIPQVQLDFCTAAASISKETPVKKSCSSHDPF